jgi:UDP-2-acetamido-2,6-beta-L-arabino-hexul-4-ose reductase
MRVVVTGADGFVGKNLMLRLSEQAGFDAVGLNRVSSDADWEVALATADAVIHLAGVNRPDDGDFSGNWTSAERVAEGLAQRSSAIPVILSSSAKAIDDTPYGESKRRAEAALSGRNGGPVAIYRLPNIFGKWARPNYNSGVATFCHNVAHGLPIRVDNSAAPLSLVYVDDVIDIWLAALKSGIADGPALAEPVYHTTVGAVAALIEQFREDRGDSLIEAVGVGLTRALYATYVSYLPKDQFAYPITAHRDQRGAFSEMLKTRDSGQFSFFTALPGVTRGGHYHHTKTEKFLIVHGQARFRFRHMLTGETHEIDTDADAPQIVETIPGWTHDVTNIGDGVMVSMLWANEIFDRTRPDTIQEPVLK